MNRRQFIMKTAYCGAAAVCGGIWSMFPLSTTFAGITFGATTLAAQTVGADSPYGVQQQTKLLLGTLVTLTAVTTQTQAEEAFGKAFLAIEEMATIFDRRCATTALGVLNDTGKLAKAPQELCAVLHKAQSLSAFSSNAFNPAIAPVLDLYKAAALENGTFTVDALHVQEALALAHPAILRITDTTVVLPRKGMRLTLDGIAKGYIADIASQTLLGCGVKNHMVNAGGDICVAGLSQKKKPWAIGIEHPARDGRFLEVIALTNGAIATSGNYEQFFDAERKYHHIIHHQTGKSPAIASVTVKAPTAMEADGLATTLALLPPPEALALVARYKGADCLIFTEQGERYASHGI